MKIKSIRKVQGFTLIEIVIVVLIIGVLAAIGFVQYSKSLEINRAGQAANLTRQIAAANHMYSLDNRTGAPSYGACTVLNTGNYTSGQITNVCNSATCQHNQNDTTPCDLVACGYLPARNWDSLPWSVYAVNPADTTSGGPTATQACLAANSTGSGACYGACATRHSDASSPYNSWGYVYNYPSDQISPATSGTPQP